MRRTKISLAVLGLLCVTVGFIVGFRPLTATASPLLGHVPAQALACGSAFAPQSHSVTFTTVGYQPFSSRLNITIESCPAARHRSLVATIVLFVAGALLLGWAVALSLRRLGRPSFLS